MVYKMQKIPSNERPRERLIKKGAAALTDYELLAIILRTGTTDMPVLDLARHIIISQGNIGSLNNITIAELKKYKGIKNAKAVEIIAAIELGKRVHHYQRPKVVIKDADDFYEFVRYEMENLQHEEVRAVYMNSKSEVIESKLLSIGSTNNTTVDQREIIKWALKLSCRHFILCHNHPSGDSTPSLADKVFTNDLILFTSKMGVNLVDHIIIGKNSYFSFMKNKN